MKRKNLSSEKSKTRDAVTELTGYCLIVALHQRFGFGRARLDRLAARVTKISESVGAEMDAYGNARALAKLRGQAEEICCAEFRVPLLRACRSRREEDLRRAGDEAASATWQCVALALHELFGFGTERLNRLREEGIANYAQFNEMAHEDMAWAMEKLRHCVQQALQDEVNIVNEDDEAPLRPDDKMRDAEWTRKMLLDAALELNREKAAAGKPLNVLSPAAQRAAAKAVDEEQGLMPHYTGRRIRDVLAKGCGDIGGV